MIVGEESWGGWDGATRQKMGAWVKGQRGLGAEKLVQKTAEALGAG